jgi:hypothetical protein
MQPFACSPEACDTFRFLPDGATCALVGRCPALGLHPSGQCLGQYADEGNIIYLVALPAGPEKNPYGSVSVIVRRVPSPMGLVTKIGAVFQDENHLTMCYQTTLVKSVLAHASILLEGDKVIFIPKYAGSLNNPARGLLNRIQRKAIKGLPGCTYCFVPSQGGPCVQVHMADKESFKQCLAVNMIRYGAEEMDVWEGAARQEQT